MLAKTAVAVGKQCSVPGKHWAGCPTSDKDKRFLCTVIEFSALHDFGGGIKGAGFQVKEMGEDGKGSLERGVASGEVFILAYPTPFLEYFWYANVSELDAPVRLRLFPTLNVAVESDAEAVTEEPEVKKETTRPPVFNYLEPVASLKHAQRDGYKAWLVHVHNEVQVHRRAGHGSVRRLNHFVCIWRQQVREHKQRVEAFARQGECWVCPAPDSNRKARFDAQGCRYKAILERYLLKYSKGGKGQVHEDDFGLIEDTDTICEECIDYTDWGD